MAYRDQSLDKGLSFLVGWSLFLLFSDKQHWRLCMYVLSICLSSIYLSNLSPTYLSFVISLQKYRYAWRRYIYILKIKCLILHEISIHIPYNWTFLFYMCISSHPHWISWIARILGTVKLELFILSYITHTASLE